MAAIRSGGTETLQLIDLPIPRPDPDELLVRVKALGLNPLDTKVRKGYLADGRNWPLLLGWDVAGAVESVGPMVTRFKPGDEVFYCADIAKPGASAEYHLISQQMAAPKPRFLTFIEAASIPLAGSTVLQALTRQGRLALAETIVIYGAAGGVGGMGVMIARALGAKVIGVCSDANVDYVRSLGANEVIDYTTTDPVAKIMELTRGEGAPVVFDTVGGNVFRQAMESVAPFGRLLFLNAFPPDAGTLADLNPLRLKNVALHAVMVRPSGDLMKEVAEYATKSLIQPTVDRIISLDRMAEGHLRLESGHGKGKVVVDMAPPLSETVA